MSLYWIILSFFVLIVIYQEEETVIKQIFCIFQGYIKNTQIQELGNKRIKIRKMN